MKITESDVGRKVYDGRNRIETITGFRDDHTYAVLTNADETYTDDGHIVMGEPNSEANLVGFVDEKDSPSNMAMFILGRLVECTGRTDRETLSASLLSELKMGTLGRLVECTDRDERTTLAARLLSELGMEDVFKC